MFTVYNIGAYDEIHNYEKNIHVYTQLFTNMDNLSPLNDKHPFVHFFDGFTHKQYKNSILDGFYHIPSKTCNVFVEDPKKVGNALCIAWKKYWEDNNVTMNVFSFSNGIAHQYNELEDNKQFYKNMVYYIIDNLLDNNNTK